MTPEISSRLMPLLRRIDPETAHRTALRALGLGLAGHDRTGDDPALGVQTLGLHFSNPIGLAAGFDKDAIALGPLSRLGFGFLETGTVTPRPQAGNPRPRLFRLEQDQAIINRMGFNNAGLEGHLRNLARRPHNGVPIGANVGVNKDGADPERDYPAMISAVAPHADYVVVNVSSPNTPGLRDLQEANRLRAILQAAGAVPNRPPLLVKIAPDLEDAALAAIVETCVAEGVQGLIVSNTTTTRPAGLVSPQRAEAGGLSGAPLFSLATAVLARTYLHARGRLMLIGVGGVFTGEDVLTKIQAGASLVQLYTSFAWHGPALIGRLKHELTEALARARIHSIAEAVGAKAQEIAGRS